MTLNTYIVVKIPSLHGVQCSYLLLDCFWGWGGYESNSVLYHTLDCLRWTVDLDLYRIRSGHLQNEHMGILMLCFPWHFQITQFIAVCQKRNIFSHTTRSHVHGGVQAAALQVPADLALGSRRGPGSVSSHLLSNKLL